MSCCSSSGRIGDPRADRLLHYISDGIHFTRGRKLVRLSSQRRSRDLLGALTVRLGFGRNRYRVPPGLYALGDPDEHAPVLVTANYKLSVDYVRCEATGLDAFLLVLDTRGINVWCAAGKGTFGTEELVRRIEATGLKEKVKGRTLILPQLGATGVKAREVQKRTGFRVVWGPVRISDLRRYLGEGMKADRAMRTVTFSLKDRLLVTPIELVQSWKLFLPLAVLGVLFSLLKTGAFNLSALHAGILMASAIVAGAGFFPLILPLLPGRAFALKGTELGVLSAIIVSLAMGMTFPAFIPFTLWAVPISGFVAVNFTGATTFTSVSGVKRELRIALPLFAFSFVAGSVVYFFV